MYHELYMTKHASNMPRIMIDHGIITIYIKDLCKMIDTY